MSTQRTAKTADPVFETKTGEARVDDQTPPSIVTNAGPLAFRILDDERLAAAISAYLDGELSADHSAAFEMVLRRDQGMSLEVALMRRLDHELKQLGEGILAEPIPPLLVAALPAAR